MTPEERDRMWRDPNNWRMGVLYHNPDDPRVVVPKRHVKWTGWTLNVAHSWKSMLAMVGFTVLATGPMLVMLRLGIRGFSDVSVTMCCSVLAVVATAYGLARG